MKQEKNFKNLFIILLCFTIILVILCILLLNFALKNKNKVINTNDNGNNATINNSNNGIYVDGKIKNSFSLNNTKLVTQSGIIIEIDNGNIVFTNGTNKTQKKVVSNINAKYFDVLIPMAIDNGQLYFINNNNELYFIDLFPFVVNDNYNFFDKDLTPIKVFDKKVVAFLGEGNSNLYNYDDGKSSSEFVSHNYYVLLDDGTIDSIVIYK
jgi:hypothetical protein